MGAIGIGTPIYYHSTPIRPGAVVDKPEFVFEVFVANAGDTIDLETINGSSGAPNFKINWGEGSDQTLGTTTTSHTYTTTGTKVIKINKSGTVTPVNNFSVLATNQGKAMVTKITSWGNNDWYSLDSAFKDCVNLTSFDTGEFKGLVSIDLTSCFEECTSLASIDIRNWDISGGSTLNKFSLGCVLVENLYLPKLTPRTGSWSQSFESVGTSVTNGCTFHFEDLDFTGSTNTSWTFGMRFTKINPLSSFKNWKFVKENIQMNNFFQSAEITGDDSILDMSGWTTFSGNLGYFFFNFNALSSVTGTKLKINNLNTADVRNLDSIFASAKFYFIEGLSTWGAVTYNSGSISINAMLNNTTNLAISSTDNLSDAFMDSLKPTLIKFAFRSIGKSLDNSVGSEWGAAPNLGTIDLSGITSATQMQDLFDSSRFSSGNIDFTNIKFPTIGMDLYRTFYLTKFSNSDSYIKLDTGVSGSTLNVTRLFDSFSGTKTRKITIGDSVDFSTNVSTTGYRNMFQNASGDFVDSTINTEIILPTNMDFSNTVDAAGQFLNMFNGTRGIDSIGSTLVALSNCQTNNFLRRLSATLPVCPPTVVAAGALYMPRLDNGKYSGPQALVSNDYSTLISGGWTFGTLASEDPYFSIPNYIPPTGTTQNITFATGVATDGTWTVTNGVATIDNSTPASPTITAATNGNGVIRYTLTDGCYNEVNFTATIPLIANNFSFNFDGINDNLTMDPFDIPSPNSTLTMWFNSPDIGGPTGGNRTLTVLFSKQGQYFPYIDETAAGKIQMYVRDAAGITSMTTSVDFNANEWYHLAIAQSSTGLDFYINGQKMNSTAGVSRYPTALTRISGYPNNTFNLLGKIDEMAVWNTTLTDAQILDIYNGRLGVTNETVDLSKYDGLGGNLVYWNRMGD